MLPIVGQSRTFNAWGPLAWSKAVYRSAQVCQMKLREWESGRTRHYLELNSSVNCYFYECVLYACDTTANKTGEATPLEWLSV